MTAIAFSMDTAAGFGKKSVPLASSSPGSASKKAVDVGGRTSMACVFGDLSSRPVVACKGMLSAGSREVVEWRNVPRWTLQRATATKQSASSGFESSAIFLVTACSGGATQIKEWRSPLIDGTLLHSVRSGSGLRTAQVLPNIVHRGELSACSDAKKARSDSSWSGPNVVLSISMVAFFSVSFQVPKEKFTRVNCWALRLISAS
jgi:hypothetical protein